jgi:hypothetical protein
LLLAAGVLGGALLGAVAGGALLGTVLVAGPGADISVWLVATLVVWCAVAGALAGWFRAVVRLHGAVSSRRSSSPAP